MKNGTLKEGDERSVNGGKEGGNEGWGRKDKKREGRKEEKKDRQPYQASHDLG